MASLMDGLADDAALAGALGAEEEVMNQSEGNGFAVSLSRSSCCFLSILERML